MSPRSLVRAFKLRGFSLAEEALHGLLALFEDPSIDEKAILKEIIGGVDRSSLLHGQVTLQHVQPFIDRHTKAMDVDRETSSVGDYLFEVIDAFETPRFDYSVSRKTFEAKRDHRSLFGEANDKAAMYEERYLLVHQRLKRHPVFSGKNQLTAIESLLGVTGECYVLGFLSQLTEGEFYLEDTKSHCKLDITSLKRRSSGMFTEGCLVIAKGEYKDDVFVVSQLALPPYESQETTEATFPGVDFFGKRPPLRILKEVQQQVKYYSDANMYVFSDVWLDNAKLRAMFVGLNESSTSWDQG